MSRIDDLIHQLCPDEVEYKPLGHIGNLIRGSGLQKKDFTEAGVGCIHYGQIYTHYGTFADQTISFVPENLAARLRHAQPGDLVIAATSENDEDLLKAVAWLGGEAIAISGDSFAFRHEQDPKYIAYLFQSSGFQDQKRKHITGTKVRRVSADSLRSIRIPVPPMEVQREIVRVLDSFTELEAELEAELRARRQQYEHYRDDLLSFPESSGVKRGEAAPNAG